MTMTLVIDTLTLNLLTIVIKLGLCNVVVSEKNQIA